MCNISLHLFQDAITDLNADCECLSFEGLTGCVAHKGILQAATYVKNTLEEKGILEAAFDRAQVSTLWKQHLTELRLVCYIMEAAFDRAQVIILYYGSSIWQSSG